jgi:hypothetical protein
VTSHRVILWPHSQGNVRKKSHIYLVTSTTGSCHEKVTHLPYDLSHRVMSNEPLQIHKKTSQWLQYIVYWKYLTKRERTKCYKQGWGHKVDVWCFMTWPCGWDKWVNKWVVCICNPGFIPPPVLHSENFHRGGTKSGLYIRYFSM